MTFATFGSSLKIFNIDNGVISESLRHNVNSNVGERISWSGDGQYIVGPIENNGALPVFKYENRSKLTRMRCIRDANASTAAFLNGTNRFVAIGSKTGAVKLWSVKDKKIHQTLCQSDTEPVKLLEISDDDLYVAAAGKFSHVKMYGVTTNKLLNTLPIDYPAELSDLKFSVIKRNFLGCSSLEGSVIVWDVHKSIAILNLRNAHIGACTGISMSPINHNIIASIALSDSFVLHDIRKKAPVLQSQLGVLGSCVELLRTEPYALIGARDGRLLVHDLRLIKTIYDEIVDDQPITCVRAVITAKSKTYEDVAVGTPENEITEQPCEMSVADIFTPPSTVTAHLASKVVSMNLVDVISPITPATGQRRSTIDKTTSTPNPPLMDSFMKIFDSPATSPTTTGISFRPTPSPLAALVPTIQRPVALNGINEVTEEEETAPTSNIRQIVQEEFANMKEELVQNFKEIIRNEMNEFQQQFLEFKENIQANIERNRFAIFRGIHEIEDLRNVVRLEQVLNEIDQQTSNNF